MKKAMVYILALTMVFSAFLTGCGENQNNRTDTTPTQTPQASVLPETMTPNPEDGVVNDDDGIIDDVENGLENAEDKIIAGTNDMERDVKDATNPNAKAGTNSGNGTNVNTGLNGNTGGINQ